MQQITWVVKKYRTKETQTEQQELQHVRDYLMNYFYTDIFAARYDEVKFNDGRLAISVRTRENVILLQYKSKEKVSEVFRD